MKTILLALDDMTDRQQLQIKELASGYHILTTTDEDAIREALEEIEVAAGHVSRELVMEMPNVRWYQQWGAGADWIMRHPEAREKDWVVTNASGIHSVPISEHLFALMLAQARRIADAVRAQDKHEWVRGRWEHPVFELAGKTMVLIGVGAIGARTARIAAAMDMRVIGVRRNPEKGAEGVARMVGPDELDDVLPEADLVVLTVPLTPETKGMIGSRQLELMKATATIYNIGRGGTIDQDALIEAIREGQIAGAGLDVTDPEPLPEDSPLWDLDNVIITAHYAGRTPAYDQRGLAIFLENLKRYLQDQPLKNRLDLSLGIRVS